MTETIHSRRILRNIIYGLSTWIFPLFLGLITTRVIVRSFGNTDYGIYALVLGFIGYSFNFSVGRAITKYLAAYRAAGETEKIQEIICATTVVAVGLAIVGSIIILSISKWLVVDIFSIEPASQAKTVFALQLSAATVFVLLLGQVGTSVLQGLHRFDILSRIQNLTSIFLMTGNLLLALKGFGLVALLLWTLAVMLVSSIGSLISARYLLVEFTFRFVLHGKILETVVRYSASIVLYQILANGFFIFERSLIVSRLGAETLTFYVIPMTLGMYMQGFVVSLCAFIFPLASELNTDRERLLVLYHGASKGVVTMVAILVATLVTLGDPFLGLWLGADFAEHSADILVILVPAFGIAAATVISYQTAEATGWPSFNLRNIVIGVLIASPLAVFLSATYGALGVAIGRVAFFSVSGVAIAFLELRTFGNVQTAFWIGLLVRVGIAATAATVFEHVIMGAWGVSWLGLVVSGSSGLLVYGIILYILGTVTSEDRRLLRRIVKREA